MKKIYNLQTVLPQILIGLLLIFVAYMGSAQIPESIVTSANDIGKSYTAGTRIITGLPKYFPDTVKNETLFAMDKNNNRLFTWNPKSSRWEVDKIRGNSSSTPRMEVLNSLVFDYTNTILQDSNNFKYYRWDLTANIWNTGLNGSDTIPHTVVTKNFADNNYKYQVLPTVNALMSYSGNATSISVTDSLRGGIFNLTTLTGNVVDSGVVFPSAVSGYVWKRQNDGNIKMSWYNTLKTSVQFGNAVSASTNSVIVDADVILNGQITFNKPIQIIGNLINKFTIKSVGDYSTDLFFNTAAIGSGLKNCIFLQSDTASFNEAIIICTANNCTFQNNIATTSKGLIRVYNTVLPSITNTVIQNNNYFGAGKFKQSTGKNAISIESYVEGVVIKDNRIAGNNMVDVGIQVLPINAFAGTNRIRDIVIENNQVTTCQDYGINVYSRYVIDTIGNVLINNNTIDSILCTGLNTNKGMGIYVTVINNIKITNNKISHCNINTTSTPGLPTGAIGLNSTLNSVISNNFIKETTRAGIYGVDLVGTRIIGNNIENCGSLANLYLIRDSFVTISNNTIKNNLTVTAPLILLDSSVNSLVVNNTFDGSNSRSNKFWFNKNLVIQGNAFYIKISNTNAECIYFNGNDTLTFKNNTLDIGSYANNLFYIGNVNDPTTGGSGVALKRGVYDIGYNKLINNQTQKYQIEDSCKNIKILDDATKVLNNSLTIANVFLGDYLTQSVANNFYWGLTGNNGTNPSTNFIGTIDAVNLNVKANNTRSGFIDVNNSNSSWGYSALASLTSGANNTAIGRNALLSNSLGARNTSVGVSSLQANTIGNDNTAIGYQALLVNTGSSNAAFGNYALTGNTTGIRNTAAGFNSLNSNTTGNDNTAIGYNALLNSNNSQSVAIGTSSLQNSTASNNTAIGYQAGIVSTTGGGNTFIGQGANASTNAISGSTAIGNNSIVSANNSFVLGIATTNVGINNTAPSYKLDIDAKTASTGNPIRAQGLKTGAATDSILCDSLGLFRHLTAAQVVQNGITKTSVTSTFTVPSLGEYLIPFTLTGTTNTSIVAATYIATDVTGCSFSIPYLAGDGTGTVKVTNRTASAVTFTSLKVNFAVLSY